MSRSKEDEMQKQERVNAVLNGDQVDRPPFTFWYHFGTQFGPGEATAATALSFFKHFDLDILKLMNDYYFPHPTGCDAIKTEKDLERIQVVDPETCDFNEQLKAVNAISKELKDQAYFIDTIFDPWQQLAKHPVGEHMQAVAKNHPQALKRALDSVADTLIACSKLSMQNGADGIFLAVRASDESTGGIRVFEEFMLPPVMKMLDGIKGLGKITTLHLCGSAIYTKHVGDFPTPVLSWADRFPDNPSLEEMKSLFGGVVMGGIDHTKLSRHTWESIRENVLTGMRQGGKERFILANGCSSPTDFNARVYERMRALVDA
jgi:uroporphyrinogen decarboxylase